MILNRTALIAFLTLGAAAPALADPQLECGIDAANQAEIGTCLQDGARIADAAVAFALEIAMQAAQELDKVTGRQSSAPALAAGQAGWLAYRDQHCEFVASTYGGGSGSGIAAQSCRIELARARADDLMRYTQ